MISSRSGKNIYGVVNRLQDVINFWILFNLYVAGVEIVKQRKHINPK